MSAKTTGLMFGSRPTDREAAKIAADSLRSRGYSVTEELRGACHVVTTGAPYKVAIDAKRSARCAANRVGTVGA